MDCQREFDEKLAEYTIKYLERKKELDLAELDKREKEMKKAEKPLDINKDELYRLIKLIGPDYKIPKEFLFMFDITREELK